jgi:ribonuclease P protein component
LNGAERIAKSPRGLTGADFAAIFKSPTRARSQHFSLFWRNAEGTGLGMVVSKKLAGNAVRRNLVKRQARAAFYARFAGPEKSAMPGLEVVIRVATDIRKLPRPLQFAEISALFAKCGQSRQEGRA